MLKFLKTQHISYVLMCWVFIRYLFKYRAKFLFNYISFGELSIKIGVCFVEINRQNSRKVALFREIKSWHTAWTNGWGVIMRLKIS